MHKQCIKCKITKDIGTFRKRSVSSNGYIHWCKLCFKEYDLNNKLKISKRKSKYYKANKVKINTRNYKYCHNNK